MALIGTIRKNFWIMIVLIGLGLGGFILMDMFSGQRSLFGSSQFTMGEIAGKKVDFNQFSRLENILYGNSSGDIYGRRDALWNYMVEETIVNGEGDDLGIGVSKEELTSMQFGPDYSPIIQQRFRNPNTGQLDAAQLNSIKAQIESGDMRPELRQYWAHQEKEIMKEEVQTKLTDLMNKAMYTPSWMAEMIGKRSSTKADFALVQIPFADIEDSEVTVSDEDYNSYFQSNKNRFKQDEETRVIEYISFNVLPTKADTAAHLKEISSWIGTMRSSTNDSLFVLNKSGTFSPVYAFEDQINPDIVNDLFSSSLGSVIGPYIEGTDYKLAKVVDRKTIPDSVEVRHILRSAQTQQEYFAANKTIDSLKALLDAGTHRFDSLAVQFSQGPSGPKGGELGMAYPGQMVQPFNDLIFNAAEKGKTYSVVTQFGVHLVEVTGKKFINNKKGVRVAYVNQPIIPSKETQDAMYDRALNFISKHRDLASFSAAAEAEDDITVEATNPLKMNDYNIEGMPSTNTARSVVRWAYDGSTDPNQVSSEVYMIDDEVNYFTSKYIVAALKSVIPAGIPKMQDVKQLIQGFVMNEAKGKVLADRIDGKSLSAIASEFDVKMDTVTNVDMNASYVPNLGQEPKVIAAAHNLELNSSSSPIIGDNGVFMITTIKKDEGSVPPNLIQVKKNLSATNAGAVRNGVIAALKKNADIDDKRFTFY